MSFFSSQKVSVRKKEERIAESHIVQPFVLPSSSGPSPRLKEAWDKQGSDFWVIFRTFARCPEYLPKANGKMTKVVSVEIQKFLKKFMCMGQETMKKIQNKTKAKTTTKTK